MHFTSTKIRVRYAETDQMGVVHHSRYYVWFELARDELIESIGISYKDIEELGIYMPIVETNCKYVIPAHYGDNIIIKAYIEELTAVKVVINYEVYLDGTAKVLAKGSTKQTFVDKNFKITNLKKNYKDLYNKIESAIK